MHIDGERGRTGWG